MGIAKELNKAIKLLGDSAHKVIIKKLKDKHPDFFGLKQTDETIPHFFTSIYLLRMRCFIRNLDI